MENEYYKVVRALKNRVQELADSGKREILVSKKVSRIVKNMSVQENAAKTNTSMPKPVNKIAAPVTPYNTGLNDLKKQVENCRKCPLGISRIKTVFGDGNPNAPVMFIGEGPGYDEDRQGLPFVGRAGKLLDKMMEAIQLNRANAYIANVVKCHPMIDPSDPEKRGNDRPPEPKEANACIEYLNKQIEIINPKIICILGSTAMRFVLGIEEPIGAVRGKLMEVNGRTVIVIYHPAALLRNPSIKVKSWEDLKLLRDALKKLTD
jgi:DNA polymerase